MWRKLNEQNENWLLLYVNGILIRLACPLINETHKTRILTRFEDNYFYFGQFYLTCSNTQKHAHASTKTIPLGNKTNAHLQLENWQSYWNGHGTNMWFNEINSKAFNVENQMLSTITKIWLKLYLLKTRSNKLDSSGPTFSHSTHNLHSILLRKEFIRLDYDNPSNEFLVSNFGR